MAPSFSRHDEASDVDALNVAYDNYETVRKIRFSKTLPCNIQVLVEAWRTTAQFYQNDSNHRFKTDFSRVEFRPGESFLSKRKHVKMEWEGRFLQKKKNIEIHYNFLFPIGSLWLFLNVAHDVFPTTLTIPSHAHTLCKCQVPVVSKDKQRGIVIAILLIAKRVVINRTQKYKCLMRWTCSQRWRQKRQLCWTNSTCAITVCKKKSNCQRFNVKLWTKAIWNQNKRNEKSCYTTIST